MRALHVLLSVLILGLAATAAVGAPDPADPPALRVGMPAPKLVPDAWCKGEPLAELKWGRVHVVEFFATYDSASRDDFRHLTALQQKFAGRGVTVVGIATRTAREAETVEAFAQRVGDRIGYTVAADRSGECERAWMRAAQRYTLPCAFVIDRTGNIAWIGSVRTGLAAVVQRVAEGTFDPAEQARADAKFAELERDFTDARAAADWTRAFSILDQARALRPETAPMVELTRFEVTLTEKQDPEAAYRLASRIITSELRDEDRLLRRIAGVIADDPSVKNRNWDVALAAAEQAVKATDAKDGWALGALAEIQFRRGEIDRAVKTQVQAMIAADGDPHLQPKVADAMDRFRLAQAKAAEGRTVTTVPGTD